MTHLIASPQQALQLRDALARLAGATITPEVAKAIEYAAYAPVDASIDPSTFAVAQHHEYTFQAERGRDILDELHPLHEEQWAETEQYRHAIDFKPDYQTGLLHEKAGTLVQFTIRRHGELAGHMRLYVMDSMHTSTRFAQEDTLFIRPEHRGGQLGLAFLRYIEAALTRLEVREIRFDVKHVNKASVLLRRLRYAPVSTRYVKIFEA